ncbi:MAG: FliM/FliN family flagellar motor switch protein [Phycisphaerae bacterium]
MAETTEAVEEKQESGTAQEDSKIQAQSAEFSEVNATGDTGAGGSIDLLLDVNIAVTVAIGQTEIPVRRLLRLGPGSVLELDKSIGEPADLYLRDTRFATGSVVVVDGRFAVKIQQILGLGDAEVTGA